MMKEISDILSKISLFEGMSAQEINLIASFVQATSFAPKQDIIKQGQSTPGITIIHTGSVAVSTRLPNDSEIQLAQLGPYEFMSEASLINDNLSTFSAQAITAVSGYLLTRKHLTLLRIAYPDIAHHITRTTMDILSKRLIDIDQKISDILTQIDSDKINSKPRFFNLKLPINRRLKFIEPILDPSIPLEILEDLTEQEQQFLLDHTHLVAYDKGAILLREYKPEDHIYTVIQGAVEETFVHDGKIAKLNVYNPGRIIGQNYFLNFPLRSTRFTVREHATLLALSKQTAQDIKESNSLFWYKLYKNISKSYSNKIRATSKLAKRLHSEFNYLLKNKTEVH